MSRSRWTPIVAALVIFVSACSADATDPQMDAAADRARQLAAAPRPTAPAPTATAASGGQSSETSSSPSSSASADEVSPPAAKPRSGRKSARKWGNYPWPSSAWPACDPPSSSPGIDKSPGKAGIVVIVGDSLIRDGRSQLTGALADVGYRPVFICKGGMGLQWGQDQLDTLRSLKLAPRCLVFNLGINDLKGTTEQGLMDAVPLEQVGERLRSLLLSAAGIENVLVVDIAADAARAPSTLASISAAPGEYRAIVEDVGVGTIVPWAKKAERSTSIFGLDGVHDSTAGAKVRAQVIAQAVQAECG